MKVVAGLGNPGFEYEETKHNIGFKVVDLLASRYRIKVDKRKYKSYAGQGTIRGVEVMLLKPQTFMNLSGKALKAAREGLGLNTEDFIVVHDDMDLALGKIKKKNKGGDAGQKGVGSIIRFFNSDAFYRIRVGIDRSTAGKDVSDYVLSPFSPDQLDLTKEAVEKAVNMAEELIMV